MGNSEVGHFTMGAGYVQQQELVRINDAIDDGSFFKNGALRAACAGARGRATLHLMGLVSTGGVHADLKHIQALADLARREDVANVVVHAFLDGRDMPPRSALELLPKVPRPIATIHGRYYAMDRDKRWERTERSYRGIADADGPRVERAEDAVRACYASPECRDELLEPHVVGAGAPVRDRDAVIFFNFRPDRARQLTWAFMQPDFAGFARGRVPRDLTFVTMTEYKVSLPNVLVAFPPQEVVPMAQILADDGLMQFHTAETEKYAHVTYFFNGGREERFAGEDRELVPSQKVATYDLKPEMSAPGVAAALARGDPVVGPRPRFRCDRRRGRHALDLGDHTRRAGALRRGSGRPRGAACPPGRRVRRGRALRRRLADLHRRQLPAALFPHRRTRRSVHRRPDREWRRDARDRGGDRLAGSSGRTAGRSGPGAVVDRDAAGHRVGRRRQARSRRARRNRRCVADARAARSSARGNPRRACGCWEADGAPCRRSLRGYVATHSRVPLCRRVHLCGNRNGLHSHGRNRRRCGDSRRRLERPDVPRRSSRPPRDRRDHRRRRSALLGRPAAEGALSDPRGVSRRRGRGRHPGRPRGRDHQLPPRSRDR